MEMINPVSLTELEVAPIECAPLWQRQYAQFLSKLEQLVIDKKEAALKRQNDFRAERRRLVAAPVYRERGRRRWLHNPVTATGLAILAGFGLIAVWGQS